MEDRKRDLKLINAGLKMLIQHTRLTIEYLNEAPTFENLELKKNYENQITDALFLQGKNAAEFYTLL